MDHEGPGRDEREACDRCRNRTGKARLNNAINEVVEPARYSPHTSLGVWVIADIARCVPTTGVTRCKLTRCRIENSVETAKSELSAKPKPPAKLRDDSTPASCADAH